MFLPSPRTALYAGMDVIYTDSTIKLLLSRQRTSYRHAHEACKWFGGVLVSLNARSKQERLIKVSACVAHMYLRVRSLLAPKNRGRTAAQQQQW